MTIDGAEWSRLRSGQSFSVSAENPAGQKGGGARATEGTGARHARHLGPGWKISPSVSIASGTEATLADIEGPATIQHLWLTTHHRHWRSLILQIWWDEETEPSVQVPVGDFFLNGWGEPSQVRSLAVAVNPRGGFNAYFPMPFSRRARVTLRNVGPEDAVVYFSIDGLADKISPDQAYFHAAWRRSHPLPERAPHVIIDGVEGEGHYIGTYLAWQSNHTGWWGEGEVFFYLDGDRDYPTIAGTGTEDYFGGAWNFEEPMGQYGSFTGPYTGLHQVIRPDGLYRSQTRFGMYRWHLTDPIVFHENLRVTIQALGWRADGQYLPLRDDIASVAYWYQTEPHRPSRGVDPAMLDNT